MTRLKELKIARLKELENILRNKENREQSQPEWEDYDWASVMISRCRRAMELAQNKAVLDLCCGTGWCSWQLAKVAKKVVGIDQNKIAIEYARIKYEKANILFLRMDALKLELCLNFCGKFDLVVMCEVLEHFPKEKGILLLKQVAKVLKSGGMIFGTTGLAEPEKVAQLMKENPAHRHIYSSEELSKLLKGWFGMTVVQRVYVGYFDSFLCGALKEELIKEKN